MSTPYVPAALRRRVVEQAGNRCEYCGIPESATFAAHELDHIIARKHGGQTKADNLALSCALCNKHKGSDVTSVDPEMGDITPLFNPRQDRWSDHFQFDQGRIVGLTPKGRATVHVLQLNQPERVEERARLMETGTYDHP
jgi:5-methylcytosine-specific restriction endonuclease McrA